MVLHGQLWCSLDWMIQDFVCLRLFKDYVSISQFQFLGAFAKFRKATIGFIASFCPSIHMK